MTIFSRLAAVASVALFASTAQATVVSYDSWVYNTSDQIDWSVTVDDVSAPSSFTFNVEIADTTGTLGDIVGFGFNTSIDYGSGILDNISSSTVALSDCSSNSCNWNGTDAKSPDYAFSVGSNGATDFITSFSFTLDSLGETLEATTFSLVAIRGQSVGSGQEGSVKDYSATGSTHTVPELSASLAPVSLGLIGGLLLLGFERRRKQA